MNQQLSVRRETPIAMAAQKAPRGGLNVDLIERYWQELRRRRWLVAAIMLCCVAAGLAATLLMTPVYTATTRIEIARSQENVTNVEALQAEDSGQGLEFYQTQYSLLATRSLALRVARELNLADDPAFAASYNLNQTGAQTSQQQRMERAADILLNGIDIAPIRGSALVDIHFTSPDPALSAKIADEWAQQYIATSIDRRFASTAGARKYLEQQLASLREKLEKSESELVNYASDKRIIALSTSEGADGVTRTERTLVASDLEGLSAQLTAATAARIAAESAMRAGSGATADMLGNSAINGLRQERALIAAQYAKMLEQFEPGYPAAQALKSQLDALDSAIRQEESRAGSSLQRNYREAAAREGQLRAKVEGLKGQMISQRRDSIQYAIYQREVDTNRELYDSLLQRYKEIGVAGVGSTNIAVVDRAEIPAGPSSPSLVLNVLLGLGAGLAISALTLFVSEMFDQTVRDPGDVSGIFGLPLLGAIPRVREAAFQDLVRDHRSDVVEAYLSTKTSLSFLTSHGVPRTFLVTSTGPNEGKSVSAAALAEILARAGKNVVLVDGDMRNPSVGGLFGLEQEVGLSNYLAGQGNIEEIITATSTANLDVICAGPMPPNAAELLGGPRIHYLLQMLSQHYDHVLVDSPPVMGLADAPLLSTAVDGVVFTIEANRFKMRVIKTAVERLHSASAHMLGTIVTKIDRHSAAYGYGYNYGYGYGRDADAHPELILGPKEEARA